MKIKIKKFENYADLAAELVVDLEQERPDEFQSVNLSECRNNSNVYQAFAKITADEQDERGEQSAILKITPDSFGAIDEYQDETDEQHGCFAITQDAYNELLAKLLFEFDNISITAGARDESCANLM